MSEACDRCLARTWLLGRLAGHLDVRRRDIDALLALDDADLMAAVTGGERGAAGGERGAVGGERGAVGGEPGAVGGEPGAVGGERDAFDAAAARARLSSHGLEVVCRCAPAYPAGLRDLAAPPAVLHVAGGLDRCLSLLAADAVAVVGSRRSSEYGSEVAHALGRGLAAAGVTVVSGMANGIDVAAHRGALEVGGPTVAIMAGAPQRSYPAAQRRVHKGILAAGGAISELGPEATMRRWMFPARNRLVAALTRMTVVVEARGQSGALITARCADELERELGAVPGRVTSPLADGPNRLLAQGARVIRNARDVLEALYGTAAPAPVDDRPPLDRRQGALLQSLGEGGDTATVLARCGLDAGRGLAALAELEPSGHIRRGAGGRFTVIAL
jgi:DNA processing protein